MGPRLHRVLIVDDHVMFAELICQAVNDEFPEALVKRAADLPDAARTIEELRPDTVLLDAKLPSGDGISLLPAIMEQDPDARVIVLTAHPNLQGERTAYACGTAGYLGKDTDLTTLIGHLCDATVAAPARDAQLAAKAISGPFRKLAPREAQVLQHLAEGLHVQDVAKHLGLSVHTTRGYVKSTLMKLGASSQLEAVSIAAREGLVRIG